MQGKLERVLNLILVAAALVAAAVLVRREFAPPPQQAQAALRGPEFVEDWRDILPASRTLGDTVNRPGIPGDSVT